MQEVDTRQNSLNSEKTNRYVVGLAAGTLVTLFLGYAYGLSLYLLESPYIIIPLLGTFIALFGYSKAGRVTHYKFIPRLESLSIILVDKIGENRYY